MNRVVFAILGVVVAVALIVAIARQNSDDSPAPPPAPKPIPTATAEVEEAGPDPNDVPLDVRELNLGDGGVDRTSIRIDHPDAQVQNRLKEFLEAHELAAVAANVPLDCHAQIAKTSLVSVTCVTARAELDAGVADASPGADASFVDAGAKLVPKYESLTLRFVRGQLKELALADVLTLDAGQAEIVTACKQAAEPDLACEWPPTDFAISPGGTLFICHNAFCVDIDADDAPNLLRPEYR